MNPSIVIIDILTYIQVHLAAVLWTAVGTVIAYWGGGKIIKWLVINISTTAHQRSTQTKRDLEKRQATLIGLFIAIWRAIVIAATVIIVLRAFFKDIDLAPYFASASIIGVAVGIGAQSLIKDFLAGVVIVSENQYRVGDVIDIEGASGTVESVGIRTTILRDVDGNVHFFPNGMIQHVINKTLGYSMSRFTIAITPESSLETATDIINKTGKKLALEKDWKAKIIEPPAFQVVSEVTSTAISLVVSGKTQPSDQWSVTAEMRKRLLEEFETNDIELGLLQPAVTAKKK